MDVSIAKLPWKGCVAKREVTLIELGPEHLSEVSSLIWREAKAGRDLGKDEFASLRHIKTHIIKTDCYGVRDATSGMLHCVLTVAISAHCRSADSKLADAMLICDNGVKDSEMWIFLIQAAMKMAVQLGYGGLLMEAYRTSRLVNSLRTLGFLVIGCVPDSGNLMKKGWTDSFILYRDLRQLKAQLGIDQPSSVDNHNHSEDEEEDVRSPLVFMQQRPRLSYLPVLYPFKSGPLTVRYMDETDIPHAYRMYKETSQRGRGYSTDEFLSLDGFRFFVVDHAHAFVVEDPKTGSVLGAFSIGPNTSCRSVDPRNADAYMVVDPSLQNLHIGTEICHLLNRFCLDLGYTAAMGDSLARNHPMLKIIRNLGFSIIGYIPRSARGRNGNMEDSVMFYCDLTDKSQFIAKL